MTKKLYRVEEGKVISGVCGGVGDYINVDHNVVRLLYALFTCATFGTGLIVYLIASIIIPPKSQTF